MNKRQQYVLMISVKNTFLASTPSNFPRVVAWICASLMSLQLANVPAKASTFVEETVKCPVGGEKFKYMGLASISTFGAFPDGMPFGSGSFPVALPQCPKNGLVMYREFKADEITKLSAYIAGAEYLALRPAGHTQYYLAYRIATILDDPDAHWVLLSASWEAKNMDPAGLLARRYNEEFILAVESLPVDAQNFESIAARVRAANALRELGRFAEAEAMRAAIAVASDAGGTNAHAADNRAGWLKLIQLLEAPIKRNDQARAPIDMSSEEEAISRCLSKEIAEKFKMPPPLPLTSFETSFCAKPELETAIVEMKKRIKERDE